MVGGKQTVFDTVKKGKGGGSGRSFTTEDTGGCSCEQIIVEMGLEAGHTKHGCSNSAMDWWTGRFDREGEPGLQCDH